MSKRATLSELHKHSLPIHPIALPELVPHNPVSWLFWIYKYFYSSVAVLETKARYTNGIFLVEDERDMRTLWTNGFFGKGVLSRSEPTWVDRTQKRLGLGEFQNLTVEEITAIRREERKKFKKQRATLEAKQAELKKQGIVDPFIEEKLSLKVLRDKDIDVNTKREINFRHPEDDSIVETGKLVHTEAMQLMPEEVFFLKFALNSIVVFDDDHEFSSTELFNILSSKKADDPFILRFVVYHHYRSLGWCVRSGVKFGSDYLLYKRGPPFSHAEFAALILPNYTDEQQNESCAKDFTYMSSVSRVIGGVRKTLVLTFVTIPSGLEFGSFENLDSLLKKYTVTEVLYRRWVPNKNRD